MSKKLRVWGSGPWAGCIAEDEIGLPDDWDSLTPEEQTEMREDMTREWFWNRGFECGSEIVPGKDEHNG